jgi:hypothetical protein
MNGELLKLVESLNAEVDNKETSLDEAIDPVNQKGVVNFIKTFEIDFNDVDGLEVKGTNKTIEVQFSAEGAARSENGDEEARVIAGLKESIIMVKNFVKKEIINNIQIVKSYYKAMGVEDESEKKLVLNHLWESYSAKVINAIKFIPPEGDDIQSVVDDMKQEFIKKAKSFIVFLGKDDNGNLDIKMYPKKYPFDDFKVEKDLKDKNFKRISPEEYADFMLEKISA